jgi:hypothetical protein
MVRPVRSLRRMAFRAMAWRQRTGVRVRGGLAVRSVFKAGPLLVDKQQIVENIFTPSRRPDSSDLPLGRQEARREEDVCAR